MVNFKKRLDELGIVITSRERATRCRVLKFLSPEILSRTVLVVHRQERDAYMPFVKQYGLRAVVCHRHDKLGSIRQWVVEAAKKPKLILLDDDIQFFVRKRGEIRLQKADDAEVTKMFVAISTTLDTYAHVSISAREGNNHGPDDWVYTTRMLRLLAYDTAILLECAQFDRIEIMSDFDVTLQLLCAGYPNAVSFHWAQDQPGTQSPGGCAAYRTVEAHRETCYKLMDLHPNFVRIREKENKTGGEFGKRTEVTISWKKALESYQEEKELD